VNFANDLRASNESLTPMAAVVEAGKTRLTPRSDDGDCDVIG